jgi:Pentapeptide repeats (9 copies)
MKKTCEQPHFTAAAKREGADSQLSQSPTQVWSHRQMLLTGQPIVFSADQPEAEREILGQWIVDALRAGQGVSLTNAIVVGSLDSQAITASREVVLRDCIVRDRVADFAHSVFVQRADFAGTHFAQGAVFARCRFDGDVMLNGCRISGRAVDDRRAASQFHGILGQTAWAVRCSSVIPHDEENLSHQGGK